MTEIAYPPLNVLKPVADGVWIVDGAPVRPAPGLVLPVRMTVVRLTSGALWLHSPVRPSQGLVRGLAQALAELGPVRHLVAPNIAHWSFVALWRRHYPEATVWAAPGLGRRVPVRLRGLRIDNELGPGAPGDWAEEMDQAVVPGAAGFREIAFLHRASRTLILTDLIANLEAGKLPLTMRLFARANGMLAPEGRAPLYLRAAVLMRRREAAGALAPLLDRQPERVIFAHGLWFAQNGEARARRSLAWLLG
jgi:Domain of unknown function (DUF4336)